MILSQQSLKCRLKRFFEPLTSISTKLIVLIFVVCSIFTYVLASKHPVLINQIRTFGVITETVVQRADEQGIGAFAVSNWKSYPNVYLELSIRFVVSEGGNYPNLFQTDAVNSGIRAELNNEKIGIVVGNAAAPGSLSSFAFPEKLASGQTYDLTLVALHQGYVKGQISGGQAIVLQGDQLDFRYSDFWIGHGFSGDRPYNGKILSVSLREGVARSIRKATFVYLLAVFPCFFLSLLALSVLLIKSRRQIASSWKDPVDRRLFWILAIFAATDLLSIAYHRLLLSKQMAGGLLQFPTRAPFFEASAPFTDFTEIDTFPKYISGVSWASPPAEQLRIMVKQLIATTWPALWGSGVLFIAFCAFGLAVTAWALSELVKICSKSQSNSPIRTMLIIGITVTAFPVLFAIDRGNAALHNTAFMLLGAALVLQGRWMLAALTFDLAAISKITPIAFILAFLPNRRWLASLLMIALMLAGILLPALILHHAVGYNFSLMLKGQAIYAEEYAISPKLGLGYSASFFSLWRLIAVVGEMAAGLSFEDAAIKSMTAVHELLSIYTLLMAVVGFDLFVLSLRRKTSLKILLCLLAIYQVMAPHIIADYYLTVLLLPLIIFCSTRELQKDIMVPLLCIAIMIPKTYLWLPNGLSALPFWISIAVPINASLIVGLYIYIRLKYRLHRDQAQAEALKAA